MQRSLRRLATLFYIVGIVGVVAVVFNALRAAGGSVEEAASGSFWLRLLVGLAAVLPYFGFGAILNALAVLVPVATSVSVARPRVESPGVTVDEVLDGPGSAALKRRILQDMVAVGDISRAQYEGALADPRLGGARHR